MRPRAIASFLLMVSFNICCYSKPKEKSTPNGKYTSLTTQCMGRHTFLVPVAFSKADVVTGFFQPRNLDENISDFDVVVRESPLAKNQFLADISKRRAQLKSNVSETDDVLRLERKLSETATLFRIQRVEEAYVSELHFLLDKNIVEIKVKSYKNSFLAAEEGLKKFMSNIFIADQGRARSFCLGSLSVQGDFVQESSHTYWRDDAGNRFEFKIDSFTTQDPKSLLQRMAGPDSLLSLFHIGHTVLRSGERKVAGMRAQEWLGWTNFDAGNDEKTFKFKMETIRALGSRTAPSIAVTFDSAQKLADGAEAKTNLSDKEAASMWDAVIDSIQPKK